MPRSSRFAAHAAGVLVAAALSMAAEQPFVRLYDAPAEVAGGLTDKMLAARTDWAEVGEKDAAHRFTGCAVMLNDKVAAVMHRDAADVDLYTRQLGAVKLCARLRPLGAGGADLKPASLTIQEVSASTVCLEAGLSAPSGGSCRVAYTVNLGEPFVKTAAAGAAKLRVAAPCRFAVVPDFFGDDLVVDAAALSVARADIPSENFLLHMMHEGGAIVMTVAQSRQSDVAIALSKTAPRQIVSSDIAYGKQPSVWVAILAGAGVWHERTVALADAGKVLKLDWKMPYSALWRVDWTAADSLNESWEMLLYHPAGKYVMLEWFGEDARSGQSFGEEFGARDWNKPDRKRWNPVLGSFAYPCWVEKDGQGCFQPLTARRWVERGEVCNFAGPAVVYPIDRAVAAPFRTPAEALTVVDLVRMTLGVGPCQYILDLEGQRRSSDGVATCYARDVINDIYKQGTQLDSGPRIEKHLDQAVAFIRNVRVRIDEYVAFGRETSAWLREHKSKHPAHGQFCDELLSVAGRLDQLFEARKDAIHTPQYAEQAAGDFRRDLLKYSGADAYARCAERMKVFTGIGGAQDGVVASCRMVVKVLRQRAGIAMAVNPELKELGTELRLRTWKVLRNPTGYEAPQH